MSRKVTVLLMLLPAPAYAHDLAWLAGASAAALVVHLLLSIPLFLKPRRLLPIGLYFSSVIAVWLAVIFSDPIERFYLLGIPVLVLAGLLAFGTLKQRTSDTKT